MNKLRQEESHRYMVGLLWIPTKYSQEMKENFTQNQKLTAHVKEVQTHNLTPPTYFEMNEFTWGFHEIVVTYGTPNYKEINPTVFNMVTFPFLFGIMFGDIGHGLLLFMLGVYLCFKADEIRSNPNL